MTKFALTFVLFYKVIATLRDYHKDFPCTDLVGSKHRDRKANYLKFRNHPGTRPVHTDFSWIGA